ncbi:hypothetical protein [Streptomyces aurantiogriseus]|uniref:Secreted protein n=1 Tax=Streptomyces aurantiogriseus TaxID=66870 RepID=A0A918FJX5_9ACTN|nr:hypothetical protein [Streptomyces aurantiogriseus]GGR43503.1 hypothetical protein GCM10010251_70690 [Streptomyces aurantiogriseus]
MKSVKAVAVIAGSLVIAGVTAPAFAQSVNDTGRKTLDNAVSTLNNGPVHVAPLEQSDTLSVKEKKASLLKAVDRVSSDLSKRPPLKGGLSL